MFIVRIMCSNQKALLFGNLNITHNTNELNNHLGMIHSWCNLFTMTDYCSKIGMLHPPKLKLISECIMTSNTKPVSSNDKNVRGGIEDKAEKTQNQTRIASLEAIHPFVFLFYCTMIRTTKFLLTVSLVVIFKT